VDGPGDLEEHLLGDVLGEPLPHQPIGQAVHGIDVMVEEGAEGLRLARRDLEEEGAG